nr:integrase, catalytic region, zinc finger, CCHC-type, peptidase aspartic, catalytic [Tanacetum cinerariifolium]
MLIMQAQENGVVLDKDQLLFIAGGQTNTFDDDDVDEAPVQDLALNEDNVFQADQCDAFDSDVDEDPTAQTMFMENISSAGPIYDEVGLAYDLNILSKVQDHDNYIDSVGVYHEGIQTALVKEVKEMKEFFEQMEAKVEQNAVDKQLNTASRFFEMHDTYTVKQAGYGDYVIGNSVIYRVNYVEGLGHNLFSVGQFYDSDLEVAFRKHSCYVRDVDGVELLKGSRGSILYTISVEDMMKSSLIFLLSKASKNKSWL